MSSRIADPVADLAPRLPSPLQEVDDDRFTRHGIHLLLKRDDLIHPHLVGNKWRKLAPNLREAADRPLLTFGGAYSNHLRATASAGHLLGLPTIGIVRGQELSARPLNRSLTHCTAHGMRLHFIDRSTYRQKSDPRTLATILKTADAENAYVVPEGGSNPLAVQGCQALGTELHDQADIVAIACGTGGTLAGLAAGLTPDQHVLGVPVLKGDFLEEDIHRLQQRAFGGPRGNWHLDHRFHFGGYARTTPELHAFATDFEARHTLPVEHLYVAKLLYGLATLTEEGRFPRGTTIAAVITGSPFPDRPPPPAPPHPPLQDASR